MNVMFQVYEDKCSVTYETEYEEQCTTEQEQKCEESYQTELKLCIINQFTSYNNFVVKIN